MYKLANNVPSQIANPIFANIKNKEKTSRNENRETKPDNKSADLSIALYLYKVKLVFPNCSIFSKIGSITGVSFSKILWFYRFKSKS